VGLEREKDSAPNCQTWDSCTSEQAIRRLLARFFEAEVSDRETFAVGIAEVLSSHLVEVAPSVPALEQRCITCPLEIDAPEH